MALELASMTDTEQQIADTMREAGYEPETPEPETETAAETAAEITDPPPAAEPEVQAPAVETAPVPEAGEEAQETEDGPQIDDAALNALHPKVRKKLNKLTEKAFKQKQQHEVEKARADELQRQLDELKAKAEPKDPPPAEVPPVVEAQPPADPEPKWEDFEAEDNQVVAYTKAMTAWSTRQQEARVREELKKEFQTRDQATERKTEAQDRQDAWNERLETVKPLYPDWDAVAEKQVNFMPALVDAMLDSPMAEHISYALAKDDALRERINAAVKYDPKTATPDRVLAINRLAAREIAILERDLEAKIPKAPATAPPADPPAPKAEPPAPAPVRPKIQASRAPAPIEPVESGSAPAGKADPDKMTPSEYTRWLSTPEGKAWFHTQSR